MSLLNYVPYLPCALRALVIHMPRALHVLVLHVLRALSNFLGKIYYCENKGISFCSITCNITQKQSLYQLVSTRMKERALVENAALPQLLKCSSASRALLPPVLQSSCANITFSAFIFPCFTWTFSFLFTAHDFLGGNLNLLQLK